MTPVPLTVTEARVILIADETLHASYEARLASGNILSTEEGDAWRNLVASAEARIAAFTSGDARCEACKIDPDPRGPSACNSCRALYQRGP